MEVLQSVIVTSTFAFFLTTNNDTFSPIVYVFQSPYSKLILGTCAYK